MKNTWSNRIEETGGATTIILFDTLNTSGARNYGSMDLLPLVAQAAAKKRAEYAAFSMAQATGATEAIDLDFTPEQYRLALESGLNILRKVPLVKGATAVNIAIRDETTGKIGTLHFPLSSPPPPASADPQR